MPSLRLAFLISAAALLGACSHGTAVSLAGAPAQQAGSFNIEPMAKAEAPNPDPRVGLKAGMTDAGQATWNMRLLSNTPTPDQFKGVNSDLGFFGGYALQGTFNGWLVWDLANPSHPTVRKGYFCPASQNDVSVYKNLLFMSAESESGRIDCKAGGIQEPVSNERIRGLRIFDISDLDNPKYIASVQTCRGSHTHTLVVDPKDPNNVYIYISGSSGIRPAAELAGCSNKLPESDPNSALFRIEVIKVPLAHPEQASVVSSPRIFNDLTAPAHHGLAQGDIEEQKASIAQGKFPVSVIGINMELPGAMVQPLLDSTARTNHGGGAVTGADSAALRAALPTMLLKQFGMSAGADRGPTQCHDITVYPAIGYAGGACEGYGMLLDIHDPAHPVRLDAASDSNFSYWHSATFNNDGTKLLFSDEWGGGSAPKCRASDPRDWGADAIFNIVNNKLVFQGYYKLSAPQTSAGKLRRAQRLSHSGARPRHHGAGVVPGRHVGVRFHRSGACGGNRVLRSRPDRPQPDGRRRRVVVVLVQRRDRQLRDCARAGCLRAAAEPVADPERARRGQDRAPGLSQRPGAAEVYVGTELCPRPRVRGPARPIEGSRRATHLGDSSGAVERGERLGVGAQQRAVTARQSTGR